MSRFLSKRGSEGYFHYQAGFNDALMLVLEFRATGSFAEALAEFDLAELSDCKITQRNLQLLCDMLEKNHD